MLLSSFLHVYLSGLSLPSFPLHLMIHRHDSSTSWFVVYMYILCWWGKSKNKKNYRRYFVIFTLCVIYKMPQLDFPLFNYLIFPSLFFCSFFCWSSNLYISIYSIPAVINLNPPTSHSTVETLSTSASFHIIGDSKNSWKVGPSAILHDKEEREKKLW